MSSDVRYDASSGLIEIVYSGEVTASEMRETVRRRIAIQKETGATKVLADASGVRVSPSITDLFGLPSKLFAEEDAKRSTMVALVLPDSAGPRERARFLETASVNRGWLMRVFEDRQSAVAWLMESTTSGKPIAGD